MLNRIKSFFESNFPAADTLQLLVAVSGGKDSMALVHALHGLGFTVAIAHCNYGLRGVDSERDQQLVEEFARSLDIPVYVRKFDTYQILETEKISVQMLARKLRYNFFDELIRQHAFDYVVTAHHAADSFENFFIYLVRNNPSTAWKGIAPIVEKIIRPNLYTLPGEISDYLQQHQVKWREDISNAGNKYLRNKIRHFITAPIMEEEPALLQEFIDLSRTVRANSVLESNAFEAFIEKHVLMDDEGNWSVQKKDIETNHVKMWLYKSGFNKNELNKIIAAQTGAQFPLGQGVLNIERNNLTYVNDHSINTYFFVVDQSEKFLLDTPLGQLKIDCINKKEWDGKYENDTLYFDATELDKTLTVRSWKEGDRMVVFGLNKSKKVSDIFTDAKIEMQHKSKVPVITSNDEIIALAGLRRSNHAPVHENTRELLRIRLIQNRE